MKFYHIPKEMKSCVWEIFKITFSIIAAIIAAVIAEHFGSDWHSQIFCFILIGIGLYVIIYD